MLTEHLPQLGSAANEQLLKQLEDMILAGRMPHAIVIEGENPLLNDKLARLLARAYLCECETPLAGECLVCRKMESSGQHPDIINVEGSGKTGAISISAIRELQEQTALVASEAKGTVCLLEGADSMESAAQNAFLKLFEEPPPGVMLIMTCASGLKLLETIRSRAVILKAVWQDDEQGGELEREMAQAAESFALTLLESQDIASLLAVSRFSKNRKDQAQSRREMGAFLEQLREVLRQALLCEENAARLIADPSPASQKLAGAFSADALMNMIEELSGLEAARRTNASMPLLTTAMCVRLRRAAGR